MNKKHLIYLTFLVIIFLPNLVRGAYLADGVESFPESYKPYLYELKNNHPNWTFKVLYTGLNWNDVINREYGNGANLVPITYSDSWKSMDNGLYNVEVDRGWVNASREAIEYVMDTRNFLNERRIFEFELLAYDETNNIESIEKILNGTEFYNRKVSYRNSEGEQINTDDTYSDLILDAAEESKVSSYNLASRIKQEVGPYLSHKSISGTFPGYEGYYNFYNIGATSSTEENGAIRNGLEYAKTGKNMSDVLKAKFHIPWNTPARAITGGAIFIGDSYIAKGQYNLYLQKFDVNNTYKNDLFWHQYMTNCLAPYTESYSIWNGYNSSGLIDDEMIFVIPVYESMPKYLSVRPDTNMENNLIDNKKVYANVTTSLNVRCGPSTNFEMICRIPKDTVMTQIGMCTQGNDKWARIVLNNGIEGYVSKAYIENMPESNDNNDSNTDLGEQENAYVNFADSVNIVANEIRGVDKTVSQFLSLIDTNLKIEFYNKNNKLLGENDAIGTGTWLILKDKQDNILYEFVFIKYGDVNGDAKINSLDVLVLQKHILEIKQLKGVYLKAGNISKNGKLPSALDVLKIQKHILEIKEIGQ